MKKILAALMAAVMTAFVFAACGSQNAVETQTVSDDSGETQTAVESELGNLPDDLNFDGTTLRIALRNRYTDYVVGEDSGDVIWSAVYYSNLAVDSRLNINREYILGSELQDVFANDVVTSILAGSDDYDVVAIDQYYGTSYVGQSLFANMKDPYYGKYLDLDADWWYSDYMEHLSIGDKNLFFLGGDISPTILAWASCTFFNWQMYEDYFGDPNGLFDIVNSGEWTVGKLSEMCKTVYKDLDDSNSGSADDILGFTTSKGQSAVFACLAAGMQFSKRLDDGTFELTVNTERNQKIFEAIFELYNNTQGVYTYDYSVTPNMNTEKFAGSQALFLNEYFLYALKSEIRDMKDGYGIIPRPKFDEEEQSYRTAMQDSLFLYTVPTTISTEKVDAVSAFLEAQCIENYKSVFPAMYDTALKVKFKYDEINSQTASDMIDLIYNNMTADFAVVYDNSLNNFSNKVAALIETGKNTFSSTYASAQTAAEKNLEELMKYYQS